MKWLYLTVASFLFIGSGVGLFVLKNDGEHSRDVLGTTAEESETIEIETEPADIVQPVEETPPQPVDENIQRQLNARNDSINHSNCEEDGSTEVTIDEDGDGVNISINSSQTATSGDVTNDGSGGAVSGDARSCSSANINVEITQ